MTSTFSWLAYAEDERRRALDVIDLYNEKTTQDELGIGTVRDALSDILFPGTSTIQRGAKYLLFVPWTYTYLEAREVQSSDIARRAREEEVRLIDGLVRWGEKTGVIGIDARKKLKRLPSSIYWVALGTFGIRLFRGSQDEYHRSLTSFHKARRHALGHDRREGEAPDPIRHNWHPNLPPRPQDFPQSASLKLNATESEYLAERIRFSVPQSLLAHMVDRRLDGEGADFAWMHPHFASFPPQHRHQLAQAQMFSDLIAGASLLYNVMLAQLVGKSMAERSEQHQENFKSWSLLASEKQGEFSAWDRQEFWSTVESEGAKLGPKTRQFVERWWDLVVSHDPLTLAEDPDARQLIAEREQQLKKSLARLQNPRALEMWGGSSGAFRLDFRWTSAREIIDGIVEGLRPPLSNA